MAAVEVQHPIMPDTAVILDPSDKFRPENKHVEAFRDFTENCEFIDRVKATYYEMHTNQTVDYVKSKHKEWLNFDHRELTIMEALEYLNGLVDHADPDVNVPNIMHAFQTAERIREKHPDKEWFQLTGLIHDLGKVMAMWGEPQFSTVGDTFVVGCEHSDKIVFGKESFKDNPDSKNPKYNTRLGMYKENCGLRNVLMSWGHDEYMYHVLTNHPSSKIPEEGLYMIRYHSFYPWHTSKEYMHLCDEKDLKMLDWILEFNQFDLYSKSDAECNMEELMPYYQGLIDKYVPGKIKF